MGFRLFLKFLSYSFFLLDGYKFLGLVGVEVDDVRRWHTHTQMHGMELFFVSFSRLLFVYIGKGGQREWHQHGYWEEMVYEPGRRETNGAKHGEAFTLRLLGWGWVT